MSAAPSVCYLLEGFADPAEREARRRHQVAKTFERVNGRQPADDGELDAWIRSVRAPAGQVQP